MQTRFLTNKISVLVLYNYFKGNLIIRNATEFHICHNGFSDITYYFHFTRILVFTALCLRDNFFPSISRLG